MKWLVKWLSSPFTIKDAIFMVVAIGILTIIMEVTR